MMVPPTTIDELGAALAAHVRLCNSWSLGGTLVTGATYGYESPAMPGLELTAADVTPEGALDAVEKAANAQTAWAATPSMARARVVQGITDFIRTSRETFAESIVLESGKTITHARAEVDFCLLVLETLLASVAESFGRSRDDFATGRRVVTVLRPVGPALILTPWNFPLNLGVRKLATALLAGCTVIWKPSDRTPLTAMILAEGLERAGVPTGVVSVIPTSWSIEVVRAIMTSGSIRKLSFTGSTPVGKALMKQAADQMLRTSFELGGNGPAIVGEHADLESAADAVVRAKFVNNGQVCTTINRLYVPRDSAEQFVGLVRDRLAEFSVNWPHKAGSQLGPLISAASVERLTSIVSEAAASGATVTTHGTPPPTTGNFLRPTIVFGVTTHDRVCQEELFGPVLPIVIYDDLDTALREANSTPYGLSAYVFSDSAKELEHCLESLRAGMIAVNSSSPSGVSMPFGGVGWSGFGRENGVRGLSEFLDETTYVY